MIPADWIKLRGTACAKSEHVLLVIQSVNVTTDLVSVER